VQSLAKQKVLVGLALPGLQKLHDPVLHHVARGRSFVGQVSWSVTQKMLLQPWASAQRVSSNLDALRAVALHAQCMPCMP
jgi:hypothetical protein